MAAKNFVKKEAIDFGFETAKKNLFFFITLLVTVILTYVAVGILQIALGKSPILSLFVALVRTVVGLVISMGIIKISLEFIDKKKPKLSDLYFTRSILNYFLVSVVKTIIVVIGFILLIIPGIIFSIKLQFASYLVVDKNMGVTEALNKSWEMTKGVKWNLFLFGLLIFLINVIGFLCLIIGLVVTVPLSMVATAYVYRKLL